MKSPQLLFIAVTLALILLFTVTDSHAIASKTNSPQKPGLSASDVRKLIESVDTASNTVTIQFMSSKTEETYIIDAQTKITVNGNPGALGDIHVGMQAVDLLERDAHTLDGISVDNANSAPETTKKKKKKTA